MKTQTLQLRQRIEKKDTYYVKYLPLGATMFAARNSLCLVGYNVGILQNNNPALISNKISSHPAKQVT